MVNRHFSRDDGGLRTRRHANRHHLCGQGPITLGIFRAPTRVLFFWRDYLMTMNSGLLDQLL